MDEMAESWMCRCRCVKGWIVALGLPTGARTTLRMLPQKMEYSGVLAGAVAGTAAPPVLPCWAEEAEEAPAAAAAAIMSWLPTCRVTAAERAPRRPACSHSPSSAGGAASPASP